MELVVERPDVSRDQLADYVNNHAMPGDLVSEDGWDRVTPPKSNAHRSIIWDYGVVYDRPAVFPKAGERRWYCQATEACRDSNFCVLPGVGATANCSLHLTNAHQTTSKRSQALKARRVQNQQVLRLAVVEKAKMVREGGENAGHRHDKLKYVKNIVIGNFQAFNYLENDLVRQHYKSIDPAFPVEQLHHKVVRHFMNELYSATQKSVTEELEGMKARMLAWLFSSTFGRIHFALRSFWEYE